jgi:hypothetical protein
MHWHAVHFLVFICSLARRKRVGKRREENGSQVICTSPSAKEPCKKLGKVRSVPMQSAAAVVLVRFKHFTDFGGRTKACAAQRCGRSHVHDHLEEPRHSVCCWMRCCAECRDSGCCCCFCCCLLFSSSSRLLFFIELEFRFGRSLESHWFGLKFAQNWNAAPSCQSNPKESPSSIAIQFRSKLRSQWRFSI